LDQKGAINNIGFEAFKWIAQAIEMNSSVDTIDLSRNIIKSEGAEWIAHAIRKNSMLQEIN
jgi:Ran GTPase-activating protein (RanGAP) involved in mRNA processing and transport